MLMSLLPRSIICSATFSDESCPRLANRSCSGLAEGLDGGNPHLHGWGIMALFVWLLWGDFAWSMRDRSIPPVITLLFKNYGSPDMLTAS